MNAKNRGIALLCGVGAALAERLAELLYHYDIEARLLVREGVREQAPDLPRLPVRLDDPVSIEMQLDTVDRPLKALINHAAQPLVLPQFNGQSGLRDLAYAPYELYRGVIRHMPAGGNIVSLFGDPGPSPEPRALTLPALKKITTDLAPLAHDAGVCMNGVSVRYVAGVSDRSRERILESRLRMVAELAQRNGCETSGEFFRGYSSEVLNEELG